MYDYPKLNLSIIIPAYNEEQRLQKTLNAIENYFSAQPLTYEIIVVDDGSKDETCQLVRTWIQSQPSTKLVALEKNQGKGHAVQQGILAAEGESVLILDADGATPIEEFERLQSVAQQSPKAIVIGSRSGRNGTLIKTSLYRRVIGRTFHSLLSVLTPGIVDTQCGFKLFPTKVAKALFNKQTLHGFAFDVEILHTALKNHVQVIEVPINWENQPGSKVNVLFDSFVMFLGLGKISWQSFLGHYDFETMLSTRAARKSCLSSLLR